MSTLARRLRRLADRLDGTDSSRCAICDGPVVMSAGYRADGGREDWIGACADHLVRVDLGATLLSRSPQGATLERIVRGVLGLDDLSEAARRAIRDRLGASRHADEQDPTSL